ncbi:imidazole glycerol phosphate synthase subunit HisH [Chloroflexota bacterium]
MIAIIDYGAGNIGSVVNAVHKLGYGLQVTDSPEKVLKADAVILPGVGEAGNTMSRLEIIGMSKVIRKLVEENRPLFAICVGFQILLSNTEEGGGHECLNILPGMVRRLPTGLKIPHMGWNQVKQKCNHSIFDGIPDEANFYFVHSYYTDPVNASLIAGTTNYGISFCSMIIKGNLIATQFHPEKSGGHGLRMYSNFLEMTCKRGCE